MKRLVVAMAVGVALLNAASAQALTSTLIVSVPEPSSFVQLAAGLLALVGLAFAVRRRARSNESN